MDNVNYPPKIPNPPPPKVPYPTLRASANLGSIITSGTTASIDMKMAPDPWVEELKRIKKIKDNSYVLVIHNGDADPYPTPSRGSIKTLVFDTFDACNVTEQIIRKDNFKKKPSIRKYFCHNKQFFEMSEVKQ